MPKTEEKKTVKSEHIERSEKKKEKGLSTKEFWKVLLPYMKPYTKNIILATVFSLLTGFCVALQPFVIKYIVDTGDWKSVV